MQLVGTISGEVSPTNFNVALSNMSVGKGSYVKINHEDYGWVLARITDIKRSINASGEEVVLAKAYTIGYKLDNVVRVPKTPFKPMDRVYSADGELIMAVVGLKRARAGNIYLGILEGCSIPVYVDLNKTIRKHMSVLAMTGAGKSYTVGVILEELLKNDIPVVIVDPHREYQSLKYENDDYDNMLAFGVRPVSYASMISEFTTNPATNPDAKRLSLNLQFDVEELSAIMPVKLADKQKMILYNALRRLEGKEYTLQDLINNVRLEKGKDLWKVISVLESIQKSGLFDVKPVTAKDLVKTGRASIIDLKGSEPWIQQLVVTRIAKDLFAAVKLNELPAFFFLIEEAHNFCPERGFGEALSSEILRTIASEGRKFGLHLCVVSQRPARVDKNVLSQCNTQIILKVTNPNDLRAIGQSIEGFTSGMESDIRQLSVGQAMVVGESVEQPITVNIRARETKHITAVEAKGKVSEGAKRQMLDKIKPMFVEEKTPEVEMPVPDAKAKGGKGIIKKLTPVFIGDAKPAKAAEKKAEEKTEPEAGQKKGSGAERPKQRPEKAKKKGLSNKLIGLFLKDEEEMRKR